MTRGLVWLEGVHYNGDKLNTQRLHTLHWSVDLIHQGAGGVVAP